MYQDTYCHNVCNNKRLESIHNRAISQIKYRLNNGIYAALKIEEALDFFKLR